MVIVIMIVIIIDTTWNVTPDIWYILIWSNHIQFPFKNQKHRSSKVAPVFQRPQKWRVNLSCFCQALEKSSRATSIQGSPWWAPCFPIENHGENHENPVDYDHLHFSIENKSIKWLFFFSGMTGYVSKLGLTALRWSRKNSWLETSPFLWIIDATLGATHDIYVVP